MLTTVQKRDTSCPPSIYKFQHTVDMLTNGSKLQDENRLLPVGIEEITMSKVLTSRQSGGSTLFPPSTSNPFLHSTYALQGLAAFRSLLPSPRSGSLCPSSMHAFVAENKLEILYSLPPTSISTLSGAAILRYKFADAEGATSCYAWWFTIRTGWTSRCATGAMGNSFGIQRGKAKHHKMFSTWGSKWGSPAVAQAPQDRPTCIWREKFYSSARKGVQNFMSKSLITDRDLHSLGILGDWPAKGTGQKSYSRSIRMKSSIMVHSARAKKRKFQSLDLTGI